MIPLVKSTFYNEPIVKRALIKFLRSSQKLSIGNYCLQFEHAFSKFQKRKYTIMVNSGSSANLAIIQTLLNLKKIKKGDRIGFSALTWSTNVMPLIQLGLEPIPIDIELDTLNVSLAQLQKAYDRVPFKLLFLTNLLGFCGDIGEIALFCKKNKIIMIEDNCESLGSEYRGKKLGNFGLASTFSFYVGHHMSTIEGGAICTDSERVYSMLNMVRAHGWDRNLTQQKQLKIRDKYRVNSTFYSRYTFYDLGYNFRTTEINGFIGLYQLKYINEIIRKRQRNFFELATPIYHLDSLYYPLSCKHMDVVSNFAVPVICKSIKIRQELVKRCEGVLEIRPIVGGDMTMQPFFRKYVRKRNNMLNSNARLIHEQGLYFGNNPELTGAEKKTIIKIFTK